MSDNPTENAPKRRWTHPSQGDLDDDDEDVFGPFAGMNYTPSAELSPLFTAPDESNVLVEAMQQLAKGETPDEYAEYCKAEGNAALKKGTLKDYREAVDFYTRGLSKETQMEDKSLVATLFANRAQAHLMLENYGQVIADSEKCLKLEPRNIKAMYRAAKAALKLQKWMLCTTYCNQALQIDVQNKAIREFMAAAQKGFEAQRKREEEQSKRIKKEDMIRASVQFIESKGIKLGQNELQSSHWGSFDISENTIYKQLLASQSAGEQELYFQVIFAYDEVSQTDMIQEFYWNDTFEDQLSQMFPPNGPPFPFGDSEVLQRDYVLGNIRIFFTDLRDPNNERYVEVFLNDTLGKVLRRPQYRLPVTFSPVFHVLRANSPLLKERNILSKKK